MAKKYDSATEFIRSEFGDKALADAGEELVLLDLSRAFRKMLEESGISVTQITKQTGAASRKRIEDILRWGENLNPTIRFIIKVAHACGYRTKIIFEKVE